MVLYRLEIGSLRYSLVAYRNEELAIDTVIQVFSYTINVNITQISLILGIVSYQLYKLHATI